MNVREMKKALVEICTGISPRDCMTACCPLVELCNLSRCIPINKKDNDIIAMYNESVKQGIIKED